MQDQLDRIERKLDDYAKQTATNTADLAWLKRIGGFFAGIMATALGYVYRSKS